LPSLFGGHLEKFQMAIEELPQNQPKKSRCRYNRHWFIPFGPAEYPEAHNLTGLYAEGFDGTGQTIGIIDWCGSLTIQSDANAFAAQFDLPPLKKRSPQILMRLLY
jgi:subtilase family serine protease